MKHIKGLLFVIIGLFIFSSNVLADLQSYGTYTDAKKMIQEVIKDYYMRGPYIQYHHSRAEYGVNTPEDATSQETNYAVCANFVYGCYVEAFGMVGTSEDNPTFYGSFFPKTSNQWETAAAQYYSLIDNNTVADDCSYIVYYEKAETKNTEKIKFVCKHSNTSVPVSSFAQILRVGDVLTYSGHTLVVYDVVKKSENNYDALIINAVGGSKDTIPSRINLATRKLFYNNSASPKGLNNIIDISSQGGIKYMWLSEIEQFFNNGVLDCSKSICMVFRPFHNGGNGAEFNYSIDTGVYNNAKLRTEYPGLYIEKTVSAGDNNSVYPGDELTYSIKVKNMSGITKAGADATTYSTFYIDETLGADETLGNLVHYISSSGVLNNNTITFTVSNLAPNEERTLTYKVKVKKNASFINKTIESNGIVYKSTSTKSVHFTTGIVKNKIIKKVSSPNKSYQSCFTNEREKGYTGLQLIDQVYLCARGTSYNFASFSFDNLFQYDHSKSVTTETKKIRLYADTKLDSNHLVFKNMILNKYWGGLTLYEKGKMGSSSGVVPKDTPYLRHVPSVWDDSSTVLSRNRNINSIDFRDGDVLIYYIHDGFLYDKYTNLIIDFNSTAEPNKIKKLLSEYYVFPYYEPKPATSTNIVDGDDDEGTSSTDKYYMYTFEDGLYAYVYVNGRFVGINGTGATRRYQFIPDYYGGVCSNLNSTTNSICTPSHGYDDLYFTTTSDSSLLSYINYQTLFAKDAFVILRPELAVNETINYIDDNNSLERMKPGETFSRLIERIDSAGDISVLASNRSPLSTSSTIRTGAIIQYSYSGGSSKEKVVSVLGDTDGTGVINNSDVSTAYGFVRSKKGVSDAYSKAADITNDSSLKVNDVAKLYQYTRGKITSLE